MTEGPSSHNQIGLVEDLFVSDQLRATEHAFGLICRAQKLRESMRPVSVGETSALYALGPAGVLHPAFMRGIVNIGREYFAARYEQTAKATAPWLFTEM